MTHDSLRKDQPNHHKPGFFTRHADTGKMCDRFLWRGLGLSRHAIRLYNPAYQAALVNGRAERL